MRLAELFEQHQGELFRYVTRFTGDADLAEDVVQDVFVRLAERPPKDDAALRGWLYRAATTIAIDALRSARRRIALVHDRPDRVPMGEPPPDAAVTMERDELRARVRRALAELNEKERTVLLMREEGFTHREIAETVGTTTGSVGTMFARALEKLTRRLQLDGGEAS